MARFGFGWVVVVGLGCTGTPAPAPVLPAAGPVAVSEPVGEAPPVLDAPPTPEPPAASHQAGAGAGNGGGAGAATGGESAPTSSGPRPLEVALPGGERVQVDATTLGSLDRTADGRGRLQGWDLVDVLHLATGGARPAQVRVVFRTAQAEAVVLKLADPPEHYFIVKHTGSGDLRIQQWPTGRVQATPEAVYRDIARVVVLEAEAGPE